MEKINKLMGEVEKQFADEWGCVSKIVVKGGCGDPRPAKQTEQRKNPKVHPKPKNNPSIN